MNRLSQEKSPYLLQHQNNPVDWYPWGPEALEKAKAENKPIFLSIGYATCHWCHVMEHDSFEIFEVAELLNRHFVPIKVDREERPDLDALYMAAVTATTGRGGWPMSVFLTPELKPFFAGTFFWKAHFVDILNQIERLWVSKPSKLVNASEELMNHLIRQQTVPAGNFPTPEIFDRAFYDFQTSFDPVRGGFGGAPKFPRSLDLSFLLRYYLKTKNLDSILMVEKTLEAMARGGIYDHLGGGFHRYATDAEWLTPHFEKMLYDNALLVVTYLEAWQVAKKPLYHRIATETLDYVLREMTSKEGGFYSAEDADSEGEEGKFYVWSFSEVKALLTPEEFEVFKTIYALTEEGNFEHHKNILHRPHGGFTEGDDPLLVSANKKLLAYRDARIHPLKDDKILTSWNGLMIKAFAKGARVLNRTDYLQAAQKAASFIQHKLYKKAAGLLRRYRDNDSCVAGKLEDYAYLIDGLLSLYTLEPTPDLLSWICELQQHQDLLFWDEQEGGYFIAAKNTDDLVLNQKDGSDGAVPAGNSVTLHNLIVLFEVTNNQAYYDRFVLLATRLQAEASRYLPAHAQFLIALDRHFAKGDRLAPTLCYGDFCEVR